MSNEIAMKLWKDVFGNKEWAQDCFGTWIKKGDYGVYDRKRVRPNGDGKKYHYGWDVDHIRPVSSFSDESDADFYNNYEPMHRNNNQQKSDDYTHFTVRDKKYKVVNCDVCSTKNMKGYGIADVRTGKRVDWKGVQRRSYK